MTASAPAFARALLRRAQAAFRVVPDDTRGPVLESLDQFLAHPAPATFLAASRRLSELQRAFVLSHAPATGPRPAVSSGLSALRGVPRLPPALADRLSTDLPRDPGAGRRLLALAALARAYGELAGRVAADTEEMKLRWKERPARAKAKKKTT